MTVSSGVSRIYSGGANMTKMYLKNWEFSKKNPIVFSDD